SRLCDQQNVVGLYAQWYHTLSMEKCHTDSRAGYPSGKGRPTTMIQKFLGNSRYLIFIAVLGSYLAAAMIMIYSGFLLIHVLIGLFLHPDMSIPAGRQLLLECIELIDALLLGTAFYIVALGLYELFINRHVDTPNWLLVQSLDDLKARLLAVIILVLSVFFLEQVINWDRRSDILSLGIAEALMIVAITLAIRMQTARATGEPASPSPQTLNSSGMQPGSTDQSSGSKEN